MYTQAGNKYQLNNPNLKMTESTLFQNSKLLVKKVPALYFHPLDDQLVKSMETKFLHTEGLNNFVRRYSNYIGFGSIFSFRCPLRYSALIQEEPSIFYKQTFIHLQNILLRWLVFCPTWHKLAYLGRGTAREKCFPRTAYRQFYRAFLD